MALKIGKIKHKPGIRLSGPLYQAGPFARYNRALAEIISQKSDYDLGLAPEDSVLRREGFLSPLLESRLQRVPASLQFELMHQGLPSDMPLSQGKWIHAMPWEYGSMPQEWQDLLSFTSDEIWVHTPENRSIYLREGLSPERVAVIPAGVDSSRFHTKAEPLRLPGRRGFCFLFSGEALWYSGIDLLLKAYADEFLPDENVTLVIRNTRISDSQDHHFCLEQIRACQANPDNPPIIYLDRVLSPAEEAGLYTACQAFVSPFRAEAFGQNIFEAMACGLPVVLSGSEERLGIEPENLNIWLKSRRVKGADKQMGGIPTLSFPTWFENNGAELRYQMRQLFEKQADYQAMGQAASEYIHSHFSWENVYAKIQDRLQALLPKPIFRMEQARLQEKTLNGLEALHAGQVEKAQALFEEVLQEDPDNPVLHLDLGSLKLQEKDFEGALAHFQKALPKAPGNANLYSVAGIALYHLQATRLAEGCFLQALRLAPEHVGARESLLQVRAALAEEPAATQTAWPEWEALLAGAPQPPVVNRISLCMIVKNEERFLRTCLESVREVVDEMIVVDTGSTDRTVEIAEEMGALVSHFEWTGSFSEARNQALAKATGDWVLILDADEVLSPDTVGNIRELVGIQQPHLTGYQFKIRNFNKVGNEVDTVEHYMLRLFPRHPDLHYTGYIHEQVEPRREGLIFERMAAPDVLVLHYGYTGELMAERDKYLRNLELIQASLLKEPQNPFHSFNLGLTHRVNNENEEALAAFLAAVEKSLKLEALPTYMAACWCYIASIYLEMHQPDQALKTCQDAPELCQKNPDYWVNLGSSWSQLGEFEKSVAAFQSAMALRLEAFTSLVSDRAATTWKPFAGIGNAYLMQQDLEKADHYFRRALRENPQNTDIRLGLARLALLRQKPAEARKYLQTEALDAYTEATFELELGRCDLLEGKESDAETRWLTLANNAVLAEENNLPLLQAVKIELGNLYLRQNQLEKAGQWLASMEHSRDLVNQIARYHFRAGSLDKVRELYSGLIERSSIEQASDFRHRGIAWLEEGQLDEARSDFEKALSLAADDVDSLHNLGVIALHEDNLTLARSCFEKVRGLDPAFYLSSLDLAKLELAEENPGRAHALLQEVLKIVPKQVDALMLLGWLESTEGNTGQASVHYMDILEQDPTHTEAMTQLGYLLLEAGESGQALQLFDRAQNLQAPNLSIYNGIGLAFLQQERYEDARNAFLLAYQLEPDNPEIQKALTLADQLVTQLLPS
jgi:tetratricopeptide (TPR) repeat protein